MLGGSVQGVPYLCLGPMPMRERYRTGRAQGNFLGYFQSLPPWDPSDFVPAS